MQSTVTIDASALANAYRTVRNFTTRITSSLTPEDCMIQTMADASPTRWHMAHTTWFFETFLLEPRDDYRVYHAQFRYLFNSYYNQVGEQFPRPQRGIISRPGLDEVKAYRDYVDEHMTALLDRDDLSDAMRYAVAVGLHHEQQHQELILTDIKHALAANPTLPVYEDRAVAPYTAPRDAWIDYAAGTHEVGHAADGTFAFDNECPRHTTYTQDFALAAYPVTCGEFIAFIEDGGYERPEHWLSLGWATVQAEKWNAPLYWVKRDGEWMAFTLAGLKPIDPAWPVCHVSYFEADAFARWAGRRLPTEFEWEVACAAARPDPSAGQFADVLLRDGRAIHPTGGPAEATDHPAHLFGGVWEWTRSSYAPYPGYRPPEGAIGEYNGKFMCNQYVLRGGSVATSADHVRTTYRNFFPPEARWQFSGFRLAR